MADMPIHPITGLHAIGFTRRGPIWPVMGGAPDGGDGGGDGNGSGGDGGEGGDGKTFTQADVDRIVGQRLARQPDELAKKHGFETFDQFTSAAGELKKIQDGEKTELQKMQDQITALTGQADQAIAGQTAAQTELLKFQVAAATEGFPIGSATRLQGTTREEIEADAKKFLDDLGATGGGPRPPNPNPQQGNSSGHDGAKSVSAGAELYQQRHKKATTQ
ncbi:hypothetical protein [Gordonia sp. 4N]|uniref:hypothetical protein n=1 Tax=Gordonia sp. 4N TaxID=2993508 RepID=UPI002248CA1A|nr:hypothetical protein [Gordonia sp. 4N]MCX2753087.1 hypothetical protein [Gordonia sp. 4N]